MKRQHLFLLALIAIVIAIAPGCAGSGQDRAANHDAILSDLNSLAADCYQYRIRPASMGGGGGTYSGYVVIPAATWGKANPNATYEITTQSETKLVIKATSKVVNGATIVGTWDANGVAEVPIVSGF